MTALTTHAPVLLIAIPLLGAFATPLIGKLGRGARNTLVGLVVLVVAGLAALLAVDVFTAGAPTIYEMGGGTFTVPLSGGQVPVRILFEVDSMSAFMGLITALIALTGAFFSFSGPESVSEAAARSDDSGRAVPAVRRFGADPRAGRLRV